MEKKYLINYKSQLKLRVNLSNVTKKLCVTETSYVICKKIHACLSLTSRKRKGKTFNQIQVETALIQLGFRCNIWRNISIFN